MKLTEKDTILTNSFKEFERSNGSAIEVPAGYVEIRLSTKGKLGAPEVFHIRNFKVGELLNLSLSTESELPRRLISTLNSMIYEAVKEVEELMVYVYTNFYQDRLDDVVFPLDEEDFEYIKNNKPEMLEDLEAKRWVPRTSIVITQDADLYDVADDFNPNITITNKKTGFYVTFGFIKYEDRLLVKDFLDSYYADEEKKFAKIKNQISQNNNSPNPIPLNPDEEREYMEYVNERFETLANISRLVSVVDYNGMDVSQMDIALKFETLSNDARIDFGMISALTKHQEGAPFGIKPYVRMKDPITGKSVERRFSFRIPLILQAIQISGSSQYDDGSYAAN